MEAAILKRDSSSRVRYWPDLPPIGALLPVPEDAGDIR